MTIQPYQPAPPPTAPARLTEWADEATAAYSLAERLVTTSFAPATFRGKPIEGAAAILAGSELGLSPMASLNAFDVIQGRPAPRAMTLRAVAQSQGHSFRLVKSTETECVIHALRRGDSEWQTFRWTIDRARRMGLLGKDQWEKQPQAMLLARATSEAARFVAADALLGVPYAAEEIDDDPEPATRTVSRLRPAPPVVEEPPLEPPVVEQVRDEPAADGITQAQLRKIGVLMREQGMTDRDLALQYVADTIGRQIGSRSDLTKDEASQVIDRLAAVEQSAEEPALDGDDPWAGAQQ